MEVICFSNSIFMYQKSHILLQLHCPPLWTPDPLSGVIKLKGPHHHSYDVEEHRLWIHFWDELPFCPLLALWHWENYRTFLILSFLTCKWASWNLAWRIAGRTKWLIQSRHLAKGKTPSPWMASCGSVLSVSSGILAVGMVDPVSILPSQRSGVCFGQEVGFLEK